jgi:hypothetical protein
MLKANYPCTEEELYTICRLGWQSFEQNIDLFTAFKTRYTLAFAADRKKEVEEAAVMPNFQTRDAIAESFRIELMGLSKKNLANWQKLKRYLADAFPIELQKPQLEGAGQDYYAKAGNEDWDAFRGLVTTGSTFINTNTIALQAGENMPPSFQAAFDADKVAFETKHQAFLDSREQSPIEREKKVKANNDIYARLMSMFLDGQEIFKDEDAVLKQYIFDQVLRVVSGTGTAGIRGVATDAVTGLPIAGLTIEIEGTGKTAITDEDGKYMITQVASGKYNLLFSAEGYQAKKQTHEIIVGTVSTLNITLAKI